MMPFGLHRALAMFMQFINKVQNEHLYKGILVYLDDILIYTKTMANTWNSCDKCWKSYWTLNCMLNCQNASSTSLAWTTWATLCLVRGGDGSGKVKSILEWQTSHTHKQLQSFLRFANFYKQFIPSFTAIASPITELLKTGKRGEKPWLNQPLNWTMECQAVFKKLKGLFTAEPVLKHPSPKKPFVIQTDANVAMGMVLLQAK